MDPHGVGVINYGVYQVVRTGVAVGYGISSTGVVFIIINRNGGRGGIDISNIKMSKARSGPGQSCGSTRSRAIGRNVGWRRRYYNIGGGGDIPAGTGAGKRVDPGFSGATVIT